MTKPDALQVAKMHDGLEQQQQWLNKAWSWLHEKTKDDWPLNGKYAEAHIFEYRCVALFSRYRWGLRRAFVEAQCTLHLVDRRSRYLQYESQYVQFREKWYAQNWNRCPQFLGEDTQPEAQDIWPVVQQPQTTIQHSQPGTQDMRHVAQ